MIERYYAYDNRRNYTKKKKHKLQKVNFFFQRKDMLLLKLVYAQMVVRKDDT